MEHEVDSKLTKEIQKKELNILYELDKILNKNNIPYFLACGTMLGCIRHKNFIPWDDDVDIYIFGKDYVKLKKLFDEQDTGILELHDFLTKDEYPYTFPKIVANDTVLVEKSLGHLSYKCGIYIDIFPLVEVSNNFFIRKLQEFKRYFDYTIIRAYYINFDSTLRKFFSKVVRKFINPSKIQQSLFNQYKRSVKNCKNIVDAGTFGNQALLELDWFQNIENMSFDSYKFPVPVMYEKYLIHYYGDYMELPPENQRISNHNFAYLSFEKEK